MTMRRWLPVLLLALPLSLVVGCSGSSEDDDSPSDGPTVDCTGTVPTYSEVTMWTACTSCHSSTLSGGERAGAPPGIDYDTYAGAKANADLGVSEVYEGAMPYPDGSGVTDEQKTAFYTWAKCGTPE